MSSIILTPIAAGSATTLTPVPGARANYLCVADYPNNLGLESYVYEENATNEDLYDMSVIEATQRISIDTVTLHALCAAENLVVASTAEVSLLPNLVISRGDAETLTAAFVDYVNEWNANPETDLFWTIADINAIEAGVRLDSAGAGTESRCTQLFVELSVSVLGEFISNFNPFYKDVIHVDQGFSVIAQEDNGRSLFGSTTVRIDYKDPDGTTGNITGNVIDENRIIAPVTAAINAKTGKWWFKLYAVLASGEILEGVPFFVNVQSKWV